MKVKELLTPLFGEADSFCYLFKRFLDEVFELSFIFDDDWTHRPLEVVPDLLDWVEVR